MQSKLYTHTWRHFPGKISSGVYSYHVTHDAAGGHDPMHLDFKRVSGIVVTMVTDRAAFPAIALSLRVWIKIDTFVGGATAAFWEKHSGVSSWMSTDEWTTKLGM